MAASAWQWLHAFYMNKYFFKEQTFWHFEIKSLLYHNIPFLILCIVFRGMNTEGQENNTAACVMLLNKNFKCLPKGNMENCITFQWKEMLNTNINATFRGLYKNQWVQ